jgi:hypothetical protein
MGCFTPFVALPAEDLTERLRGLETSGSSLALCPPRAATEPLIAAVSVLMPAYERDQRLSVTAALNRRRINGSLAPASD